MSMTVGDLIRPDDVPDAIKTAVQTAIAGYTSSYGATTITQTELLNNVNDKINDFKTEAEEITDGTDPRNGVTGKRIKPYAVLNLIYAAMRQACRLGTISYSYYSNTGYVNSPGYTPPVVSQSLKVLFGTVHSEVPDVATYCSKVAAKYPRVSDNGTLTEVKKQADNLISNPIRVLDITDLLDKCIQVCRSLTRTQHMGYTNTCYSSCHSNCHGSSRSRR